MLLLPIGARRSAYILGFFKTKTFSKPIPGLAKPPQNQYSKPFLGLVHAYDRRGAAQYDV